MYLILPIACTLFQSSKSIKFGHRPYSSYEKSMYLITMYSIPLYLITAPHEELDDAIVCNRDYGKSCRSREEDTDGKF